MKSASKYEQVLARGIIDERNKPNSRKRKVRQAESAPSIKKSPIRRKRPNRMRVLAERHGTAVVQINSKNAYKTLTNLSNITSVKVVKSEQDYTIISFKSKHLSQVIALLNKLCYDYKIIKIIGVIPSIFALSARLGVVIGVVLSILITVFCTSFVTRVSVSGCDDASLNLKITEVLSTSGISKGSSISKVDCDTLEKSLLALDGIAFASVTLRGGHVVIVVKEELPSEEFEEISGTVVVARKRAVVTRVVVNGGTAAVEYGDVVNAGDVLIDGYTLYGEDKIPVRASGEVFGKVYYQKKLYFADTTYKTQYGRTKTVTKLSFFGIMPKEPRCGFEHYETYVQVIKSGLLIPYVIYRYVFREINVVESEINLDDDALKRLAYSSLIAEIENAGKILDTYYLVENAEKGKYVTVIIEAEEKIT